MRIQNAYGAILVEVTEESLRENYSESSNAQLLALWERDRREGHLTALARSLLAAEFHNRDIDPEQENRELDRISADKVRSKPQRLGGWLILVGIGTVVAPFRLSMEAVRSYFFVFSDGIWEAVTTVSSENYHPLWAPIIIGEIIFNVAMILVTVYLIYLFFSRHQLFPRLFVISVLASVIFIPIDAWLVKIVLPDEPMFDSETTIAFFQTVVAAIIWIPYMFISKRVRATFVEKRERSEQARDFEIHNT